MGGTDTDTCTPVHRAMENIITLSQGQGEKNTLISNRRNRLQLATNSQSSSGRQAKPTGTGAKTWGIPPPGPPREALDSKGTRSQGSPVVLAANLPRLPCSCSRLGPSDTSLFRSVLLANDRSRQRTRAPFDHQASVLKLQSSQRGGPIECLSGVASRWAC